MSRTPDQELIQAAQEARERAHAPYSHFQVGAAIRSVTGQIHRGCNLENSSFGLTVCAERNALHSARINGDFGPYTDLAVVTAVNPPAYPCGACRQVLHELCPGDLRILCVSSSGRVEETTLAELLPRGFRFQDVEGKTDS